MMKIAMSAAAGGLIRALLSRAGVERDEVLLTHYRSTEWHSLTFEGERHEIGWRVPGPDAQSVIDRLLDGLAQAEFVIPGQILADIAVEQEPATHADGSISVELAALTIAA